MQQTITKIKRHFVVICIALVVALFVSQFLVLATLGAQGTEVSRVRMTKESYRLENEKIRAKIDSVRTLESIEKGLQQIGGTELKPIQPEKITSQTIEELNSLGLSL
jgi:hypothetical protein